MSQVEELMNFGIWGRSGGVASGKLLFSTSKIGAVTTSAVRSLVTNNDGMYQWYPRVNFNLVFSNNHYNPGEYVLYPYESGVSSLTDNITIYTRTLVIDLSNGKFDKQSLYILLSGISCCGPVAEGNTELMDGFDYYIEYMVKKYQ